MCDGGSSFKSAEIRLLGGQNWGVWWAWPELEEAALVRHDRPWNIHSGKYISPRKITMKW